MKEFHIISCGLSLLSNAQKVGFYPNVKLSDESYWDKVLENPQEIEKLYQFLIEKPSERSAELNSFLRVVKGRNSQNIEVYLFGTKTKSNELCRRVIEKYLKDNGYSLLPAIEISGYFAEAQFDSDLAISNFQKDIAELLDRLVSLIQKKIQQGYKVFINPTGGLKAHVMATALSGFLTNVEVYYLNEEFQDVVFLPHLFYLPKGNERIVLENIRQNSVVSGSDAKKIIGQYPSEIERLKIYGLLNTEEDEGGTTYRIKITEKGKFILDNWKKSL